MTQLELFRQCRASGATVDDQNRLRAFLASGRPQTRAEIAAAMNWDERTVRAVCESMAGEVSSAPGVSGFRLTASVPVEEWQATYGAAWRTYIRSLAKRYAAQQRACYGQQRKEGAM